MKKYNGDNKSYLEISSLKTINRYHWDKNIRKKNTISMPYALFYTNHPCKPTCHELSNIEQVILDVTLNMLIWVFREN